MDEPSLVGCVGRLIVATRGREGAGEVLLRVRGSREVYLAWSVQPLPRGAEVLVVSLRGARTVQVEPWAEFGLWVGSAEVDEFGEGGD